MVLEVYNDSLYYLMDFCVIMIAKHFYGVHKSNHSGVKSSSNITN